MGVGGEGRIEDKLLVIMQLVQLEIDRSQEYKSKVMHYSAHRFILPYIYHIPYTLIG